ncbi:MAG: phenylalanine 4-monooxygenase [Deltaproteobacteria bacterium HGW-Deltaproteobacteria-14]|jgi:phenylalanine-4-hydroxylase|nr:MAG: phenylalanine 4-monooxygenase [Deltaproteobacteria bacterium HGW-Deltaproteobacteria-14]
MQDETNRDDGLLRQPVIDSEEALAANAWAQHCDTLPAERIDIEPMKIPQRWERYTPENHAVWGTIFRKRMDQLTRDGSRVFLDGAKAIKLSADQVPRLEVVNAQLEALTGWQSHGVPGYLPPKCFFAWLAQRQFPTTIAVRPAAQMEYLPEPDIIHDVFGHVPLHTDPQFAEFLQTYGKAALVTDDPVHTERLARLFWFTVEFGLIHEDDRLKLYGSGLISSEGEGHHALYSPEVERRPFDLDRVCDTPFEIFHYQPILYVLDSFEQLATAMSTYAERLLALAAGSAAA